MEESGEGLEPGVHHSSPNVCGQDAIPVVERGVHSVGRPLVRPARKAKSIREHIADLLPIEATARALEAHERRSDFVGRTTLQGKGGPPQPSYCGGAIL